MKHQFEIDECIIINDADGDGWQQIKTIGSSYKETIEALGGCEKINGAAVLSNCPYGQFQKAKDLSENSQFVHMFLDARYPEGCPSEDDVLSDQVWLQDCSHFRDWHNSREEDALAAEIHAGEWAEHVRQESRADLYI